MNEEVTEAEKAQLLEEMNAALERLHKLERKMRRRPSDEILLTRFDTEG